MVVTVLPVTLRACVKQERTALPLTCTVHAPHSAMPQPNFVPVMPRVSRKTHSSGISGLTSTVCGLPFKVNLIDAMRNPPAQTFPLMIHLGLLQRDRRVHLHNSRSEARTVSSKARSSCSRLE